MICFFFIQVVAWMLPIKRNFPGPCHQWQHKFVANSYLIIFLLIFWKLLFSPSRVGLFMTPWTSACQASVLHSFPEFAQTYVHWVDVAIQPSHPWPPNIGSFSFSICPSNDYSEFSFYSELIDQLVNSENTFLVKCKQPEDWFVYHESTWKHTQARAHTHTHTHTHTHIYR